MAKLLKYQHKVEEANAIAKYLQLQLHLQLQIHYNNEHTELV